VCIRDNDSDEKSLSNLIEKIRNFMKSLNLPIGLKDTGVTMDGLEKNMDMILSQTPTDPEEQLKDIFLCAYDGKLLDMKSEMWR